MLSEPARGQEVGLPGGTALTTGERLSVFLRSFLLQSAWNTRDMQSVGFCFCMLALWKRFRGDPVERARFLKRHLGFFNTNPALSTFVLTAAAEAETQRRPDDAVALKKALAGPLGMSGDSLMWGALRPLAAVFGVAAVLLEFWWAPLLLLAVYNVPHLALRATGAFSEADGSRAVRRVLGDGYRSFVSVVRGALSFVAGFAVALALGREVVSPETLAVAGAFFVLTLVALRARVPVTAIGLAGVAGGVAIMYTRF